ncbi:MAG: hypothetical protein H7841_10880 [Magnetospirillum sp. WYHS-4]
MFRKTLTLALLGFLLVGGATVAYGTYDGTGFLSSLATVAGMGENGKSDSKQERKHKKDRHHDDD